MFTAHLEADFEEMETRLIYLDDLCAQCEHQRYKHFQDLQLENYKMKKRCFSFKQKQCYRRCFFFFS